jgi:hypothetical protein
VAPAGTITVASYDNAPVTLIGAQPLTFTAVNQRGRPRTITFMWSSDNSIVVSGEDLNKPDVSFREQGRCVKM